MESSGGKVQLEKHNADFYVERMKASLWKRFQKSLSGADILILGVTFQPDGGEKADDLALNIFRKFLQEGVAVQYHDPMVPALCLDGEWFLSQGLFESFLQQQDGVLILTPHSVYDWAYIVKNTAHIFDPHNIIAFPAENVEKI